MKKTLLFLITILSCAVNQEMTQHIPDPVYYYGGMYGNICDTRLKTPISNVKVHIVGTDLETTSDSAGNYYFYDLKQESITIQYIHPDYDTLTVDQIQIDSENIVNLDW